jgi:electron transport complex protein RnfB
MCVKACPAGAVSVDGNLVHIDHEKCLAYGPDCKEACVEKCPRNIFRPFIAELKRVEPAKNAA